MPISNNLYIFNEVEGIFIPTQTDDGTQVMNTKYLDTWIDRDRVDVNIVKLHTRSYYQGIYGTLPALTDIEINWGDGSPIETFTNAGRETFPHHYSNANLQPGQIATYNITLKAKFTYPDDFDNDPPVYRNFTVTIQKDAITDCLKKKASREIEAKFFSYNGSSYSVSGEIGRHCSTCWKLFRSQENRLLWATSIFKKANSKGNYKKCRPLNELKAVLYAKVFYNCTDIREEIKVSSSKKKKVIEVEFNPKFDDSRDWFTTKNALYQVRADVLATYPIPTGPVIAEGRFGEPLYK
ncbi:MAG: hypothetical protein SFU21_00205 [Flavihumibacter sp.]|nr:hypothetical protein [Flavihumibacter sp.]